MNESGKDGFDVSTNVYFQNNASTLTALIVCWSVVVVIIIIIIIIIIGFGMFFLNHGWLVLFCLVWLNEFGEFV